MEHCEHAHVISRESARSSLAPVRLIVRGRRILIFDTTLRDGEQCPGAAMNTSQKLAVARQLERLGVDIIEAGFPASSNGDFESVRIIAQEIKRCRIAALARCTEEDIVAAGEALRPAGNRGRIHIFLGTSEIHRLAKFAGKGREDLLKIAVKGVCLAKTYVEDVEFSPEDSSRTEFDFLIATIRTVIDAGVKTVNIADTVGYAEPASFGTLIEKLIATVPEFADGSVILSVHCHNDLGMATANSLAAIKAGAGQVECTVNGIGERAGNAALEEIVMALRVRSDAFGRFETAINTTEILKTSRLVSRMSGLFVQKSKAIVGANAFAHGAGIHQAGMLKDRRTYEVVNLEEVGWTESDLVLTKHSGRNALVKRLEGLGIVLSNLDLDGAFTRFKALGDTKKYIHDDDLEQIVGRLNASCQSRWTLQKLRVRTESGYPAEVTAIAAFVSEGVGSTSEATAFGDGPINAAMKAVAEAIAVPCSVLEYLLQPGRGGEGAFGEVSVRVEFEDGTIIVGQGSSTDVVEASVRALLNAINRFLLRKSNPVS